MFIFSFSKFQALIITEIHLNHCKDSPCVFNFSFFLSSFYYRSSSWSLYMVVHQGFKFLLEGFIEILFRGAQVFFILLSGVQFFLPYHWRWYYVILDNLSSCFMIHMMLRMRYFKSINLFVGVILGYISPKAFL